jgi:hypothetical protein
MENLFEAKTPNNPVFTKLKKVFSAITNPKKIKGFIETCVIIIILILALIGGIVTYKYLDMLADIQREDMAIVAETSDGEVTYVYTDTIRENGDGLIEATTVLKIGRDTITEYQKRIEAIQHGKNPHEVWGIEQDIQIKPENRDYRVVSERIIDWYLTPLVTYTKLDKYWADTTVKLTTQKSVIDEIMKIHDGDG